MAKGKLILICQSGGEFVTKDDGSLLYTGGDAHALDIGQETIFDDLKLKLAEMCNLEYKSLCLKYFIPGNRRTLITLANDKDLKRMYDFHGDEVTADVFLSGKTGFDIEVLNVHAGRTSVIKAAESMTPAAPSQRGVDSTPVATNTALGPKSATPLITSDNLVNVPISTSRDCIIAGNSTTPSPTKAGIPFNLSPNCTSAHKTAAAGSTPTKPVADETAHSSYMIDMFCTPADTVKKRRRTASWKIGANGPTIVAVADNDEEARKTTMKNTIQNHNPIAVGNDGEQLQVGSPWQDDLNFSSTHSSSGDATLEKLVASWRDGITGVGQDFKGVSEFRDVLQKYAIAHRFMYKLKKNDTNRASAICASEGCSWKIHASWVPSAHSFRIKKMNKLHTCDGESWKRAHPTKNWLVGIIKDRLRDSPHHKPKEIANGILRDFGIELNYAQVWRAIEEAREQLQGSYKDAYNQLPWFCEKMVEANPGSIAKISTSEDSAFQGLFVSFQASMRGFQRGCRPLLFLDSTSLKSKYQEILLTATALDGDDGIFPVAFAIVDVENNDNWHWFLEQLNPVVSTRQPLTFVTDFENELEKAVLDVFENAHHGYSLYHLLRTFKRNLKGPFHGDGRGSLPGNFVAAAHAVRLDGFRMCTEQIKRVSTHAYDWIMELEPAYWTNAVFKGERYNHIILDTSESYHNWIEEVRELPIIQKVEVLRCKIMELVNARRLDSSEWRTQLTPSKEKKLLEETVKGYGLKVLISTKTLFEVHNNDSINVVDIDKWDCSCMGWKATGLPCRHAIAVFNATGRSVYDYCSRYFRADSFRSTYSETINPVVAHFDHLNKEKADSEAVRSLLPPCISKLPSQPKKKQTKNQGVEKRAIFCTRCKGAGHNKATCKETL